jgi:dTDP-4-amino-4,6-dideoxygalactose transaminase
MIPHSRTVLADEDVDAATAVLRSGELVGSDVTAELEAVAARFLSRRHAWATGGGTAALYAALSCMGVGDGDEVLVPTYTCDDVLSAVLQAGAAPVPVDLDPADLNPSPDDAAAKAGPRTRAIVLAHVLGMPARVSAFQSLEIPVIEDCAHGLGGELGSGPAGSAGKCTVLSFHGLKMITAGEGGMVLTDDDEIAAAYDRQLEPDYSAGQHRLHSRMSNVLAAIAIQQFARLQRTVERRRSMAARYASALSDLGRARPVAVESDDGRRSSSYRFALVTDGTPFEEIESAFLNEGVIVRRPVKQLSHRTLGVAPDTCPEAEALFDRIVSLPLYPSLSEEEHEAIIAAARRTLA